MTISHVDDGHLHAYLDGALDAYPRAEAARIRGHLEECAACAVRLDLARGVRERAAGLLAVGVEDIGVSPPLEELRRRAAATTPRSRPRRLGALGWAASVMLALSTGWLLRGGAVREPAPVPPPPPPSAVAADVAAERGETAAQVEGSARDEGSVRDDGPAGSGGDLKPAAPHVAQSAAQPAAQPAAPVVDVPARVVSGPPPPLADATPARASVDAAGPGVDLVADLQRSAAVSSPSIPAISSPSLPSVDMSALTPTTSGAASFDDVGDPRSALSLDAIVITSQERQSAEAERRASRAERARGAAVETMDDQPGSLVVPGLELVSVSWVELAGADEAAVRILQLLAAGDTLEVLHLPPGVPPAAAPGDDGDRSRLEVEGPEGWLILRARTTVEELAALLERLRAG